MTVSGKKKHKVKSETAKPPAGVKPAATEGVLDEVAEASLESFPASDAPNWANAGTVGPETDPPAKPKMP